MEVYNIDSPSSINELYRKVLQTVLKYGRKVSPRGQPTSELRGSVVTLGNPNFNVIGFPARRLNYSFSVAEWLWMMSGQNDAETIGAFNSKIVEFSDDGETFSGAYGPQVVEQLPYVIKNLQEDHDTRQAVLTIWRPSPGPSRDIPCTILHHFFRRDDRLELITYMRSNDVWLGFPYDVFNFTQTQRLVASQLGIPVGQYTHIAGSLHLYKRNLNEIRAVIDSPGIVDLETPPVPHRLNNFVRAALNTTAQDVLYYPSPKLDGGLDTLWQPYVDVLNYWVDRSKDIVPDPWGTYLRMRE